MATKPIESMTVPELRQSLHAAQETIAALAQQVRDLQPQPETRSPLLAAWDERRRGRVRLFDLREVQ